ncbi:hypothetical protein XENOCAPTIV_019672, partial [Xenoophorus captivus]
LFETHRVKFYMLNEVSEMIGQHGQSCGQTCASSEQTNVEEVFAGGDVVTFPFPPRNNKKVNIPHWQMAHVQDCLTIFLLFCSCPLYRSEEVVAVASMNYDPIVSRVAEVLGSGKTIKKRDVE